MSKILLANPPFKKGVRSVRWPYSLKSKNLYFMYPPWFLMYSAALMEEKNLDVNLVDAVALDMDNKKFIDYVKKENPKLLLIQSETITIQNDLEILKKIKEEIGCEIALSGTHPTVFATELIKKKFIDYVLYGEFEMTALELAMNNKRKDILGLVFKNNGKVIVNPARPFLDFNELPLPARHFLPMDRYNEGGCAAFPNQQLNSSRGCPFRCIYCLWPQTLYNRRISYRDPKKVVDEMEMLMEEYEPKELYFDDDTFVVDEKHVLGICKEIKKRKLDIEWTCMCRADVRDSVMKKMRDAGCRGFKFGVESGDDDVLKKTKKGITTKQVRDFVKLTKKYKMRTYGTFMFGLPGDTKESMQKTLDFAVELDLDGFQTSITTPFPGTEFYEMAKKNKWLIEHDFSKYDGNSGKSVISYPQLSNEEINRMFEKSKTSVMRFKWEYLYSYPLAAFKRDGLKGVANLILKDSPVYMKRMIQKNLLKKKITYS